MTTTIDKYKGDLKKLEGLGKLMGWGRGMGSDLSSSVRGLSGVGSFIETICS